ncbi:MAG: sodium:proton antiporter [Planctomycetota bacterium]|nr:sodium:proton antiporter [Planctomycetota bacterium]
MCRSLVAALLALLASAFALAAEPPAGQVEKPPWAQGEKPSAIRGRLVMERLTSAQSMLYPHDDGVACVLRTDTKEYYLIPPFGHDLGRCVGLDVEIRGWAGTRTDPSGTSVLLLLQPAQAPQALVPAWWSLPFILLLACIALIPLLSKHFWERRHHQIALGLGLVMVLVYVFALQRYGTHRMVETALDYFRFIALIGSLYVVTGGILVDISGRGRPWLNTLLLLAGALIANVIGTTGASALLIRPYLRVNKDRIRPFHVVFFIFIVSNCGGVLTPIGDPPLFLGYLKGVPFLWTLKHCLPAWALVVGALCAVFFVFDCLAPKSGAAEKTTFRFSGSGNVVCLAWVLFGVFLDKVLPPQFAAYPAGALLMVMAAYTAYSISRPENLARNEFTFGPIKEVAYLFAGIFATMVPALDYLAVNAEQLGITTPGGFYFASGALSSFLDNAPTYLNFLSAAHGLAGIPLAPANMPGFISCYAEYLLAVSLGSVFFGACTYIGNGPNFMVKAIADAAGVETPSFLGYIFKYTLWILLPLYGVVWVIFFSGLLR